MRWLRSPASCMTIAEPETLLVSLQLAENVLRRRHLELTLVLDLNVLGNAILHDDREALATSAHAEATRIQLQAECLGVFAISVGEHQDLVADARGLAP